MQLEKAIYVTVIHDVKDFKMSTAETEKQLEIPLKMMKQYTSTPGIPLSYGGCLEVKRVGQNPNKRYIEKQ